MENKNNIRKMNTVVNAFRHFAEKKLRNHLEELKIRFWYKHAGSKNARHLTEKHSRIFNAGLDRKMQSLAGNKYAPALKEQLKTIKDSALIKTQPAKKEI